MTLDPKTVELLKAFFAGKVCHYCGAPASRFMRGRLRCHGCSGGKNGSCRAGSREDKRAHKLVIPWRWS